MATLEGFVRVVKQLSTEWDERLWYRGQDDADDPLIPGFHRYPNLNGEEGELRYRFQQAARQLVTSEPKNKWEWYFLMQHHGIPTRLLDWSEGALLALHFALRSHFPKAPTAEKDAEPDAAVWVLDPIWLHEHAHRGSKLLPDPEDPENRKARTLLNQYLSDHMYAPARWPKIPIPIQPPNISPRFGAQQSCFTLHGSDPDGFGRVVRRSRHVRLARIRLLRRSIPELLEGLNRSGVLESILFPDLDGLGREIKADETETPIQPRHFKKPPKKSPSDPTGDDTVDPRGPKGK